MAIRITTIERNDTTILKVDGQLVGDEAHVLQRACASVSGRLVLDLTDLWFVDRPGTRLLLELRRRGSTLTGLSPYLRLWFDRKTGGSA